MHLAAAIRDQPRGSIEELNGIATWRMVEAAERQGVERFVFFSALGASTHHRTRAACARRRSPSRRSREADLRLDRVRALDRLRARRPVADAARAPGAAAGDARVGARRAPRFQPIWAEDVADCVVAALRGSAACERQRSATSSPGPRRSATTRSCAPCCARSGRNRAARARARRRSSRARCACSRRPPGDARVRDLGRGRADGGLDGLRARHAPTRRRSGCSPQRDGRGARAAA